MSRCTDIRDVCGDYAFDVEYSENNKFTMFFNSYRNAKTVKRIIEVDDSVPNAATAVDFVEVVRCKDCKHCTLTEEGEHAHDDIVCDYFMTDGMLDNDYCSYGKRREE